MTTADLATLLKIRLAAWDALGTSSRQLRFMDAATRLRMETASETFREADAKIVAILRGEPGPAEVPGATLHLTGDRRNFVAIDHATSRPIGMEDHDSWGNWKGLLYRYPVAGAAR